ncbi:MAG: hypothetical protein U0821_25580 [Chloroflexota bacterium]
MGKTTYAEGDWLAIPACPEGFAVGRIARRHVAGSFVCYLFPRRFLEIPTAEQIGSPHPCQTAEIVETGDPFIRSGRRTVICHIDAWQRERWPIPVCGFMGSPRHAWLSAHPDGELATRSQTLRVALVGALSRYRCSAAGVGAVESGLRYSIESHPRWRELIIPGGAHVSPLASTPATVDLADVRPGTWVGIPLINGTYAPALVSRVDVRGRLLLYLFGPSLPANPEPAHLNRLHVGRTLEIVHVDDDGFLGRGWIVFGRHEEWQPEDWPIPYRGTLDEQDRAFRLEYTEEDLGTPSRAETASYLDGISLRRDRQWTAEEVETYLSRRLIRPPRDPGGE